MKHFEQAALRLTAIYILLLMGLSVICSLWLYNVASREVRIAWSSENSTTISTIDDSQVQSALLSASNERLLRDLVYFNLAVFGGGTLLSYALARRTLRPIQKNYQLQEEFASNASHELRTPLTIFKAELQLIKQDKTATPARYRAAIDSSLEEVDRLISLSARLLQLSAPASPKKSTSKIGVAITTTLERLKPLITKKGLQIELPSIDASIAIDEADLIEILSIILDNAVKFSPADSSVIIDVEPQAHHVVLSISDHGPGIRVEDIPHIFERFYRSRHMAHTEGHGLGLALAKKLITEAGGRIAVHSEAGLTRFMLQFPV